MSRRALVLALAAAAGLALPVAWGVAVEPYRVDCREEAAVVPGLPPAWEARRLALFGDLQVGILLANLATVRRVVRQVAAARPAAALLAGDFLYRAVRDRARQIRALVGLLEPLPAAGIPTYAVLGNHDYPVQHVMPDPSGAASARELREAFTAIGVRVLHNEALALDAPGATGAEPGAAALYLVGIGPHVPGADAPLAAIRQVPAGAARVVLMHNPASFQALPAGAAPLALAGHTHGGQIRVPFKPEWSGWSWTRHRVQPADGWLQGTGAPGNHLYVNRGIGFSCLPVRFGCPPELTFFTLHAA
ncbi:MAG TPA: metallophosphoesterase [Chloroflexota bacterium]|nr:metallophosphoesterase [Chloroflexota bacterium]